MGELRQQGRAWHGAQQRTARAQGRGRAPALVAAVAGALLAAPAAAVDLLELSLEELAKLRVTSVSRVEEALADAAAAVFVITGDEIRRSGATSLAEALRLAPGLEVARRNAHAWSITSRGFNSDLANKLLVLIDGRSVYSPLYAGVFWDVQQVSLDDVERIEVIAGPGGTMWGANAVNGVINVITRSALDTPGMQVDAAGGNAERHAGIRFGGTLGEAVAARAYVRRADYDSFVRPAGGDGLDAWYLNQAGFRTDWRTAAGDRLTVQGDVYEGAKDGEFLSSFTLGTLPSGTFVGETELAGGNVVARWVRTLDTGAELTLKAYYDYTHRDIPNTYAESRDTFDVDFQHRFALAGRHDILWGASVRDTADEIGNTTFASFVPEQRRDRTISAFFQDRIALRGERLSLTLGTKLSDNDYTGEEYQPSARLRWRIDERRNFWAAVSRAVRVPARLDEDLNLLIPLGLFPGTNVPIYRSVDGNPDFDSERLHAYEAGYRFRLGSSWSVDVNVFRHDYAGLQTNEDRPPIVVLTPPAYGIAPQTLENRMHGESRGGTMVASWQPLATWRLRAQYTRLDLELAAEPASVDTERPAMVGNSPEHQLAVYSFLDLPHDLELFTGVRYVDELPNQSVESYVAVDADLTWRVSASMRLSLTLRNLNDARHLEFGSGGQNRIGRTALARIRWSP